MVSCCVITDVCGEFVCGVLLESGKNGKFKSDHVEVPFTSA